MSSTSIISPLQENPSTKGDLQEQSFVVEDERILSPNPSLSQHPVYGSQELGNIVTPRESQSSRLSKASEASTIKEKIYVTEDGRVIPPRSSQGSRISNTSDLTLNSHAEEEKRTQLLSSPISGETKITGGVPEDEKPAEEVNANDMKITNVFSDDETLVFEDEFVSVSESNNDFLQKSVEATNANLEAERATSKIIEKSKCVYQRPFFRCSTIERRWILK